RVVDRTGVGLQDEGVVPDVAVRLGLDDLERLGADDAPADWESRLLEAARRALQQRRGAVTADRPSPWPGQNLTPAVTK
ncbi:MAG: hypothetical protein WAT39_17950, partial [Planctomycetota bacterium]